MAFEFCKEIIAGNITGGNAEEIISQCPYVGGVLGGVIGALLVLGIMIFLLIGIGLYVYTSLARMQIAKKLKHKYPWLAWIPFARDAQFLQLGNFHWAWIFLILIPVLGWMALWILLIISTWRIFEKRKYPSWLALIPILVMVPKIGGLAWIASLIILGFVAWRDIKKK